MGKKILVTAANGQLGSEISGLASDFKECDFTFLDRLLLDLGDIDAINSYFKNNRFDVIINTAAYTAVAKAIFELSQTSCSVNAIETKDYPTPAKRSYYSVLNKAKIKSEPGILIPYWKNSLRECLIKIEKADENFKSGIIKTIKWYLEKYNY